MVLRERKSISAYAFDLEVGVAFRHLPYYRVENATMTSFKEATVKGISLHCSYEMFIGDDDTLFIKELARILNPGWRFLLFSRFILIRITALRYCRLF